MFYFDKDWLHLASYLNKVRTELFRHEKIENLVTQLAFTCSKLAIGTLEQVVKYVQC